MVSRNHQQFYWTGFYNTISCRMLLRTSSVENSSETCLYKAENWHTNSYWVSNFGTNVKINIFSTLVVTGWYKCKEKLNNANIFLSMTRSTNIIIYLFSYSQNCGRCALPIKTRTIFQNNAWFYIFSNSCHVFVTNSAFVTIPWFDNNQES